MILYRYYYQLFFKYTSSTHLSVLGLLSSASPPRAILGRLIISLFLSPLLPRFQVHLISPFLYCLPLFLLFVFLLSPSFLEVIPACYYLMVSGRWQKSGGGGRVKISHCQFLTFSHSSSFSSLETSITLLS